MQQTTRLLGERDGFVRPLEVAGSLDPVTTATGDLNGDGLIDLATVRDQGSTLSVSLKRPDGTLAPVVEYVAGQVIDDYVDL